MRRLTKKAFNWGVSIVCDEFTLLYFIFACYFYTLVLFVTFVSPFVCGICIDSSGCFSVVDCYFWFGLSAVLCCITGLV